MVAASDEPLRGQGPHYILLEKPTLDTATNTILLNRLQLEQDGNQDSRCIEIQRRTRRPERIEGRHGRTRRNENQQVVFRTETPVSSLTMQEKPFLHELHQELNTRYAEHFPFRVHHSQTSDAT